MPVFANIIEEAFSPLISVFEAIMVFIHEHFVGGSWGLAIIGLTVVVRAVMVPLTVSQFRSMQRMQALAPEIKRLQEKYKEDKQRQQQELMKFYKENQVNPLGSCLPLVAQLPVFISLFYMLRQSLRVDICPQLQHHIVVAGKTVVDTAHTVPCGPHGGASFLFVNDLTNKATGATLIVLIVLYVGTQLASSLLMSTPTMDQTQRRIMLLMPLFFVVFIISFPAGVIVYWITTNSWTILQQYIVRRRVGPMGPPASAAEGPSSGSGGRGGPGGDGSGGLDGDGPNGAGSGGLGGLLRGRLKPAEAPAAVGAGSRTKTAPPPPPRKKKKRSGRRR
jgi:YidC/Oxa1 family membrane protein insertase